MVVAVSDNSDSFGAIACRKRAQACTNRIVKKRIKVFSQEHPKKSILIAIFQHPVIKPSATGMSGPDT